MIQFILGVLALTLFIYFCYIVTGLFLIALRGDLPDFCREVIAHYHQRWSKTDADGFTLSREEREAIKQQERDEEIYERRRARKSANRLF